MSDVAQAAEPVLANDPAARTDTGALKDQTATTSTTETTNQSITDSKDTKDPPSQTDATKVDAPVVPDKYEFKALEGQKLDDKVIEAATPIFKELGLTQEAASKLVEFYNGLQKQSGEASMALIEAQRAEWRGKAVANPELGNGTDLKPEVKATIGRAIDTLPNAVAFRAEMDATGMGDNPEFIAAFHHFAKALSEGSGVRGGGPAPVAKPGASKPSPAQALYPKLPSSSAG